MGKCQSVRMAYVSRAAFEALQTARRIAAGKGSKLEKAPGSASGSNFSWRDHSRKRNLSSASDHSPASMSSESQTLDSFAEYDSFVETPITMSCQCSRNSIYDCRSVNRKLWSHENGGVDVSLKDGFFSEIAQGSAYSNGYPGNPGINEFVKCEGDSNEEFTGSSKQILKMEYQEAPQLVLGFAFQKRVPIFGMAWYVIVDKVCWGNLYPKTLSKGHEPGQRNDSQKSRTPLNVDSIIFNTPRRLVHSLQEPNNADSKFSKKPARRSRSLSMNEFDWSPNARYGQNGYSYGANYDDGKHGSFYGSGEKFEGGPESVSSTDGIPADADLQVSHEVVPENKISHEAVPENKT